MLLNDFKCVTVFWGKKPKQAMLGTVEHGKIIKFDLVTFFTKLEMLSMFVGRAINTRNGDKLLNIFVSSLKHLGNLTVPGNGASKSLAI